MVKDAGGRNSVVIAGAVPNHEGGSNLPLMTYRNYRGWKVWMKGQAIYCLRQGLSVVAEAWGK